MANRAKSFRRVFSPFGTRLNQSEAGDWKEMFRTSSPLPESPPPIQKCRAGANLHFFLPEPPLFLPPISTVGFCGAVLRGGVVLCANFFSSLTPKPPKGARGEPPPTNPSLLLDPPRVPSSARQPRPQHPPPELTTPPLPLSMQPRTPNRPNQWPNPRMANPVVASSTC